MWFASLPGARTGIRVVYVGSFKAEAAVLYSLFAVLDGIRLVTGLDLNSWRGLDVIGIVC